MLAVLTQDQCGHEFKESLQNLLLFTRQDYGLWIRGLRVQPLCVAARIIVLTP